MITMLTKTKSFLKGFQHLVAGVIGGLFMVLVFVAPMKWIDYENCTDVCEACGDEPFWRISLGCFCKDERGLYNPKDERR